jgi:hypothetical protein
MLTRRVNELTHSHAYKNVFISMMLLQRIWQIANDSTTSCEFSVEEPGENKDDNQTLGQYYSMNYYCKKGIVVLYATLSFHLECNYPQWKSNKVWLCLSMTLS